MNRLFYMDQHNFKYEILIDRTQNCPTFFYVYFYMSGCNFSISSNQHIIAAANRDLAEKRLAEFANLACELRERFAPVLTEKFGDTPKWFYEDKGNNR